VGAETTQDLARDPRWAEEQLTEPFDSLVDRVVATDEVAEAVRDPALAGFRLHDALVARQDEILLAPAAELAALEEASASLEAARLTFFDRTGREQPLPPPPPTVESWLQRLRRRMLDWIRARWAELRGRSPPPTAPPAGSPLMKSAPPPAGVEKARLELRLDELESRRDVAARTYTEAVSSRAMLRMVRTLIASEVETSYATTLSITSAPGLAELALDDLEVATSASDALTRVLDAMGGGSIGIAGPRGVGKTTLIRAFHLGRHRPSRDPNRLSLSVMVSAPVVYQGRDFVLHLFAELCKAVLKSTSGQLSGAAGSITEPGRRLLTGAVMRLILTAVLVSAVPAGIAIALLAILVDQAMFDDLLPAVLLFAVALAASVLVGLTPARAYSVHAYALPVAAAAALGGAVLVVLAVLDVSVEPAVMWGTGVALAAAALGWGAIRAATEYREREYRERDSPYVSDDLERIAAAWLDRIRYQQTFTSGWSGSLKLPIGLEGGVTGSNQVAEQQMSFPDVVEELRGFLRGAGQSRDVLVAIDELDKMESEESARRFLNEIKGIFGIEHCFYLVSVSEDAMSRFERRGLPLRDEFDSSFDEILYLRYLTLDESRHVLRERVIGLPVPFLLLAHSMSGGLPRDLIRVTRTLVDLNERQGGKARLDVLCSRLVALELERKVRAARVAARGIGTEPHASCFLAWSEQLEVEDADAGQLLEFAGSVAGFVAEEMPSFHRADGDDAYVIQRRDREKLIDLAIELGAMAYFFAAILEDFRADAGQEHFRDLERTPQQRPAIEILAAARQEFATNRRAAWQLISEFRRLQGRADDISHPELWAPAYEPPETSQYNR
jgi:Cdc6-like AAA superfamily ATPase